MKFYPKPRIIFICLALSLLFSRLSYWQWTRHQQKQVIIQQLENRLKLPPVPFETITFQDKSAPEVNVTDQQIFKRVIVSGTYDFDHEIVVRNRRYQKNPGVYVLTPLHTTSGTSILVNRGFVPLVLADKASRAKINRPAEVSFIGLIKESQPKKFLAPADPESGIDLPWVDEWLRPDVESIAKQLPYKIAPVFLEIVGNDAGEDIEKKIIQQKSQKAEIFMPSEQIYSMVGGNDPSLEDPHTYPIPVFDPVIPPARHLGYVFEWAAMAIISMLMGFVLQLNPETRILQKLRFKNYLLIISVVGTLNGCSTLFGGDSTKTLTTSYYGGKDGFNGKRTASGEIFNDQEFTAAHRTLPFGTQLDLTNPETGKTCTVRVNDRGPYARGRDLDISKGAAAALGIERSGVAEIEVATR